MGSRVHARLLLLFLENTDQTTDVSRIPSLPQLLAYGKRFKGKLFQITFLDSTIRRYLRPTGACPFRTDAIE